MIEQRTLTSRKVVETPYDTTVEYDKKGVGDGLVATAQAGLHYKDGFGIGAKAKASVLSCRATTEFNIFGWQVELGVSGELLSIGAEATIGIFPTESGGKEFRMKAGVAPGPYGWGYVVRIKSPY